MLTHQTQIRVLYRDTDKMGVVYHANYIVFYEAARNEMFRYIGLPYTMLEQLGIAMPIVEVESKYKAPAYYDDLLTVRATIKELPLVRAVVEYQVTNERGELLNTGKTVLGYVNMERKRPCRAPQQFIDELKKYFDQYCPCTIPYIYINILFQVAIGHRGSFVDGYNQDPPRALFGRNLPLSDH